MRPRRQYRPTVVEALEVRQVPSGLGHLASTWIDKAKQVAADAATHLEQVVVPASAPTVAVIGDGLSDEYQAHSDDRTHARSWVEMLGATGKVNFGPYSQADLGDPRHQGFTLNWSGDGITTTDALTRQIPGLTAQLQTGTIDHVIVFVGQADFGRFLQNEAPGLLGHPLKVSARVQQLVSNAASNVETIVRSILATNPKTDVTIATVPDPTTDAAVRQSFESQGQAGQTLLRVTSQAVAQFNNRLRVMAIGKPHVAIADVAARLAPMAHAASVLSYGGESIDLAVPGDDARHFTLADGSHPGTIAQSFIANTIVAALNSHFHAKVKPLTSLEVLGIAESVGTKPA